MQIRPKTYLHFIWLWRSLRDAMPPHPGNVSAKTTPLLIYTAIVLASLLAMLEVDAHRGELRPLGLSGGDSYVQANFLSP